MVKNPYKTMYRGTSFKKKDGMHRPEGAGNFDMMDDNASVETISTKQGLNNIMPIGSIVAWHKDFTNTPALPENWLECNGQTVSDSASPYNGQALPDMNGNDPTNKRFILGDATGSTGATGGNDIHTHTFTGNQVSTSVQVTQGANNVASGANLQGIHTHTVTPTGTNTNASNLPKYMAMIWIIRIK